MGKLNMDAGEVIRKMQQLKKDYEVIELDYRKLSLKYEELGHSWRDPEYRRIKEYIEDGGSVLNRYKKDSEEYLDYVLIRLGNLIREYGDNPGSPELEMDLELPDLSEGLHDSTEDDSIEEKNKLPRLI